MQVHELFESAKFSVEHSNGPHARAHDMSLSKVADSILFSSAEKKRIAKLAVDGKITVQRAGIQGRTKITVTRIA